MKTKHVLAVMISSFFLLYGCSNNEESVEESALVSKTSSLSKTDGSNGSSEIHRTYPQEQREVLATFGAIATSITNGAGEGYGIGSDPDDPNEDMDQLISFHAYGDNFVEFNGGESFDSAGNEANERMLFGTIVDKGGIQKFAAIPGTLKVAVYYGNVANLTFISDFELLIGGDLHIVNNLITLLFVKTDDEWKMVHEHHSPLNTDNAVEEPEYVTNSFVVDPIYYQEQGEVSVTFGKIATSIINGAGHGYNGEYMDQLISFHAYGNKFVEFNGGQSFDSAGNEHKERQLFGEDLEIDGVIQFAPIDDTLQIAVYNGNVANLTFISDFKLMHKEAGEITVNNLITLLFIKIKGEWKMVHEHHSLIKL